MCIPGRRKRTRGERAQVRRPDPSAERLQLLAGRLPRHQRRCRRLRREVRGLHRGHPHPGHGHGHLGGSLGLRQGPCGTEVISGDLIHLRNLYGGDGGYLDTNGHATTDQKNSGGKFNVLTSQAKDRATGTGRWRIFAQTSNPLDQNVRIGDTVHLANLYGDNGGFLETNGGTTASGGKYDVCTNAYYNRSNSNVADWKIHKA